MKRYEIRVLNIGENLYKAISELDVFSKLSREQRAIIRDNSTPEIYSLIVTRGKDGYYISEFYKVLSELGLVEP